MAGAPQRLESIFERPSNEQAIGRQPNARTNRIASGGEGNTGPLWFYVFPPLLFYLTSLKGGTAILLFCYLLAVLVFQFPDMPGVSAEYSTDFKIRFFATLTFESIFCFVLEAGRLRARNKLVALAQAHEHAARTDELTGLANRQLFRDRLNHVVRRSRRSGEAAALMFLDLDGFKRINDTLGHDAGDELLRQVAQWLEGCVREEDSVARLGGDEFVVLLSRISGSEAAGKVAENILRRLCQRIRLNDHEVGVTVSIGITMIPHDSEDAGALMKYADLAMYRAKELGRNTYQFFTPAMNIQAARRLLQQEELATALDGDRFVLHYQPKVDLATQRVIGVEAFLRWHHPEKGLVSAQQFITLAEETGLIIRLGELALRQACIQVQALERAGFESLKMAVNFSVRQLTDSGFLDMIRRVITETGVSPERLELEMPAELLNEDPRMLRELLVSLNDLGVCLILDDFGTGSCSLVALQQLPLDVIKIDHRFIRDIPYNVSATDVASAVIALAHKLHLTVVAEGVETLQQLTFLKSAGCAQCQGNLFSYPLDEDALIGFLIRQYEKPLIS